MKKPLRIVLIVILAVVAFAAALYIFVNLFFRIPCRDFYQIARAECAIPGIADGAVQQGLTYIEEDELFAASTYMNDRSASHLYFFRMDGTDVSYVTLQKADGTADTTHCGGVSYGNGKLFVADGGKVTVYDYKQIKAAGYCGVIQPESSFAVAVNASFCHVDGGLLYVGEFYRAENYPTDTSHHLTTPAGEQNPALVLTYDLTELAQNGYAAAPVPTTAYSIRELVQGLCTDADGNLYLTTSYAIATSHIYQYRSAKATGSIEIGGATVPLVYLDADCLIKTLDAPPMAEEAVCVNGRLYLINESASAKYIFGSLIGGNRIYSLPVA